MAPISSKNREGPLFVRLQVTERVDESEFLEKIHKALKLQYEDVGSSGNTVTQRVGAGRLQFKVEPVEGFTVLTTTLHLNAGVEDLVREGLRLLSVTDPLATIHSQAYSTFTIHVPEATDESNALAMIDESQQFLARPRLGIGVVRGCMFSILESGDDVKDFNKHYFVSPLKSSRDSDKRLSEILEDIRAITVYSAQLSQLYSKSTNLFSALKPGEVEISERTESFLWGLIQPEPVKLETLESWLGYILEREASLSAMISTL